MSVVSYQHCPMLRRVWVLVDLLGDQLAEPGVFSEPFSSDSSNWMPANLDRTWSLLELRFRQGHRVGHMAKPYGMFKGKLAFVVVLGSANVLVKV